MDSIIYPICTTYLGNSSSSSIIYYWFQTVTTKCAHVKGVEIGAVI